MSFSVMDYQERGEQQRENQRQDDQRKTFRGIGHGDQRHQSRGFRAQSSARKGKVWYQPMPKAKENQLEK
jgi:hypothetical protein